MQVAHHQTRWAWMQSQNLCLTNSLVLGRQKMHCLETKAGAMWAPHSLTTTTYARWTTWNRLPYQIEVTPKLVTNRICTSWSVALPFVCRPCRPRGPIDGEVSTKFCGVVKKAKSFYPTSMIRVLARNGCFAMQESDFMFLLPNSGTNNFNLMETQPCPRWGPPIHRDTMNGCQPTRISVYLIYAWILDNSNCQYDVHNIAKLHIYDGCQTWNTNIWRCGHCVIIFLSVIWFFVPTTAHPLLFLDKLFVQAYLNVSSL